MRSATFVRMEEHVYGKILLFGEYSLLRGGHALSVPFKRYRGSLKNHASAPKELDSHQHLVAFINYLAKNFRGYFQMEALEKALDQKLYFNSNIPLGYGVGSSGALVAALLKRYGKNLPQNLQGKQALFGAIESHFHGKSSGLDVLVCFEEKPILVKQGDPEICHDFSDEMLAHFDVLDSHEVGITSTLVRMFNDQDQAFFDSFDKNYVSASNRCIETLLRKDFVRLLSEIQELAGFTLEKMPFTIPESIKGRWGNFLYDEHRVMKLCGSGGGGFALTYSKERST